MSSQKYGFWISADPLDAAVGQLQKQQSGLGDQDCKPVPQDRLFSRSIVEIENHLARAAAFV